MHRALRDPDRRSEGRPPDRHAGRIDRLHLVAANCPVAGSTAPPTGTGGEETPVHSNRLLRAAATAMLAMTLAAPAAAASTTVQIDRASGVNFDALAFGVSAACGVPIELHTVGKTSVTSRYDGDGRLVS